MECGCVAGIYAARASEWCAESEQDTNNPMCQSIDIMQANKGGFNVGGNPCGNGTCDVISQCQYNMSIEGK